ncbi:MAG: hypothetical protein ACTHMI_13435 [Mucilaginibacter sp.]
MDYFLVRPDYTTLAKYYRISIPPIDSAKVESEEQKIAYLNDLTERAAANGIELFVEPYHYGDEDWKFDSAHIDFVTASFDNLMSEYGLSDHRENLLFIMASLVQNTFSAFNYLQYETYKYNQRIKELAGFIHAFKNRPDIRDYELTLKSRDRGSGKLIETVKITDNELIHWMSRFVIEAIDGGNGPTYLFGIHENAMLRMPTSGPTTIRELKDAASFPNEQTFKNINMQTIGKICLTVMQYLDGETYLTPDDGKKSNDKQLELLYKMCVLFDLINKEFDQFSDVTPVRYMRTLLSDARKML